MQRWSESRLGVDRKRKFRLKGTGASPEPVEAAAKTPRTAHSLPDQSWPASMPAFARIGRGKGVGGPSSPGCTRRESSGSRPGCAGKAVRAALRLSSPAHALLDSMAGRLVAGPCLSVLPSMNSDGLIRCVRNAADEEGLASRAWLELHATLEWIYQPSACFSSHPNGTGLFCVHAKV